MRTSFPLSVLLPALLINTAYGFGVFLPRVDAFRPAAAHASLSSPSALSMAAATKATEKAVVEIEDAVSD